MQNVFTPTRIAMLQGVAIGFVVLAVVGQFYPGYMLDSNVNIEVQQARQSAVNASAAALCADIYRAAPDSEIKLIALRKGQSYSASSDDAVTAASAKAVKVFIDAKMSPEPNYQAKSECGDRLYKSLPATAALLK